jgi:ParB-like chromosome segregation protein Spo0J
MSKCKLSSFSAERAGRRAAPNSGPPDPARGRQRNARSTVDQKIERLPTDSLKPYGRHARTHSDEQIAMIMGSVAAFGFVGAIIADENSRILAGHGRWEAAKRLGYADVPVVRVGHLTEDEIRAFIIADNRLAERAGWDREVLAIEFQHLTQLDLGFELDVTGFSVGEIDLIIGEAEEAEAGIDPADEIPDTHDRKVVSRLGDLWLLGRHRLLCGNALAAGSYETLLAGRKTRMVLSDPPYNIEIDGFVSGLGKNRHREFAMASGEMSEAEFTAFLRTALEHMKASLVDGGLAYLFMDHRHLFELLTACPSSEFLGQRAGPFKGGSGPSGW